MAGAMLTARRGLSMRGLFALGLLGLALCAQPTRAALFDDDDARKAILDLRQRVDQNSEQLKARLAEQGEQLNQLKRSLLDLNNQLEAMRSENAKLRGANEQLAREVAEVQRQQKDLSQEMPMGWLRRWTRRIRSSSSPAMAWRWRRRSSRSAN